jgi:hypothetical protein|tara:strand:- start:937 stop:1371 length:435 start_codon:yes stop_codon:yes gene_type:complete
MAFNDFNAGTVAQNPELAFDLRQIYAKIVGEHLQDIAQARKADNYAIYYKALKDLYVIVKHKFKSKKYKDEETNEETNDHQAYKKLIDKAVSCANENPREWLGSNKDPEACAKIELALNDIEMFLYSKIDAANMFGSNRKIEGL